MNSHTKIRVESDGIMIVEVNDDDVVASTLYDLSETEVDTEQKVLAWVYQLSQKEWMDRELLCEFIRGCVQLHPELDVHSK